MNKELFFSSQLKHKFIEDKNTMTTVFYFEEIMRYLVLQKGFVVSKGEVCIGEVSKNLGVSLKTVKNNSEKLCIEGVFDKFNKCSAYHETKYTLVVKQDYLKYLLLKK